MRRWGLALILAFLALMSIARADWLDRSQGIFLPPELDAQLGARSSFPLFWWNFLVYEMPEGENWSQASALCGRVKASPASLVAKAACEQDARQLKPLLEAWARDYPLRHPRPSDTELVKLFSQSLAQASLPIDPSLLSVLRIDPLQSHRELLDLIEKRMRLRLDRSHGFFFDPQTRRVVIPVQFAFPPARSQDTKHFLETLPEGIVLLGPHASSLENEAQVSRDVAVVSAVGMAVLVLGGALAVWFRRWRLLLLVPPVVFSTAVSAAVTVALFGSIHGLTLSFGTAIIGLAIDYGLHSALNQQYEGNWRANFIGVLTTLAALCMLMFSEIPLLRQMMVFSILGLGIGFLTFYVLHTRFPRAFHCKPFEVRPRRSPGRSALVVVLLAGAALGAAFLRPDFDMRQFDYQGMRASELRAWLFSHLDVYAPLLQVDVEHSPGSALENAAKQREWAQANGIAVDNIAAFLPDAKTQAENLATWGRTDCARLKANLSPSERALFAPFVENLDCGAVAPNDLSGDQASLPIYLRDFRGADRWLTLWLPKSESEAAKIKERYPGALSLKEVVAIFPSTLSGELAWMAPLSFFLASLVLASYYRSASLTALSLLPFFSGLGFFSLVAFAFNLGVSFVSLIGLVMVFGFSIDYGVFATDLSRDEKVHSISGVWTSLAMATLTNAAGYLPLLFCKHPVLLHLGQTLVFGTVGTYLGAVWGIPAGHRWLERFAKQGAVA